MRKLFSLLTVVVALFGVVAPVSALPWSPARALGSPYSILQMNLCLSGTADCYARTAYPSVVDEAVGQMQEQRPEVVTLNEVCSGDVAEMARRTGYRKRFSAVLFDGVTLPCTAPRHRGVFGIAVLTKDGIRTSHGQAFATQAGIESRRWMCATTLTAVTVCTAHLDTRGSADERLANDGQCAELEGVLAKYDDVGTTLFGGDTNRREPCAPTTMWSREDTTASQVPGIQHIYGTTSVDEPFARVSTAVHTDHDFLFTTCQLGLRSQS